MLWCIFSATLYENLKEEKIMVQIKKRKKKGRRTLEFILLVTAVMVILLIFLTGNNSIFKQRYNETLDSATNGMVNMAERLGGSRYKARP